MGLSLELTSILWKENDHHVLVYRYICVLTLGQSITFLGYVHSLRFRNRRILNTIEMETITVYRNSSFNVNWEFVATPIPVTGDTSSFRYIFKTDGV